MRRTVEISGIKCEFKSSAAIPRRYRMKFGRDIFVDMNKLKKDIEKSKKENGGEGSSIPVRSLEMFENIAYLMHKHGDPSQPNNIDDWLDQFEMFDVYEVFPTILEMWNLENMQTSIPKKN